MSSRFVHVTVVPTGTVSASGPNLKLSIFTSIVFACGVAAAGCDSSGEALSPRATVLRTNPPPAIATISTAPPMNTPPRIVVSPFSSRLNCRNLGRLSRILLRIQPASDDRVRQLRQRRVRHRQAVRAVHRGYIGDSQHAAQLLR